MSNSFETPWTIAGKALLSMGFSTEEYYSGLPVLTPGDLPDTGIEPMPLACPVLAGRFFTSALPGKPKYIYSWNSSHRIPTDAIIQTTKIERKIST